MRGLLLVLLFVVTGNATAQDSSFSRIRLSFGALRGSPDASLAGDWRAGTGGQFEAASNVGTGEIALALGHLGFNPTTGKPPFTQTFFSLGLTVPVLARGRFGLDAGARLTDVRFDFDDPAIVEGLRTEEEVMLGVLARGRLGLSARYEAFVELSQGTLMLSTKTRMAFVAAGVSGRGAMPGWLRGLLR